MITIRKYQPTDKPYIQKICMDTCAKFLQKSDKLRESGSLMFIDYYINWEPENIFVADDDGIPCGYIVCSLNKELYREKMKKEILGKVFKIRFYLGVFTMICIQQSYRMDKRFNCGGFHINIDEKHQSNHLGPKMLTTMGLYIKEKGHKYLYLITKNRKTRGYGFYTHYGFTEQAHCGGGSLCLAFDLDHIEEKAEQYLKS